MIVKYGNKLLKYINNILIFNPTIGPTPTLSPTPTPTPFPTPTPTTLWQTVNLWDSYRLVNTDPYTSFSTIPDASSAETVVCTIQNATTSKGLQGSVAKYNGTLGLGTYLGQFINPLIPFSSGKRIFGPSLLTPGSTNYWVVINSSGIITEYTLLSSVCPTPTPTPTPTQVPNNIVTDQLFMKLDATNYIGSGQWIDETINGNNATINGATWVSTNGGIFDFDGINDTMTITHNSNLSLNTTQQRTIQIWVNFDVLPTSSNRMVVFGKLSSNFGFDGWWGGINSSSSPLIATNGTGISKTSTATSTISLNNWYLLTFISQITSTANTTKVYVNETEYITTFHGADGYSESNNLTIGYLTPPLTGLGLISYLNGKVGAVYFYTKGLSVSEISQNFNNTKTKYGL
jgi:hypothetical protein